MHITNDMLLREFGMTVGLRSILMERHMRWLGYICRMDDSQQPRKLLFGELLKSRPFCGTKQHWRDVGSNDLKTLDVPPKDWYALTMNRQQWSKLYTGKMFRSYGYQTFM